MEFIDIYLGLQVAYEIWASILGGIDEIGRYPV